MIEALNPGSLSVGSQQKIQRSQIVILIKENIRLLKIAINKKI
jgi:hypothetical protein